MWPLVESIGLAMRDLGAARFRLPCVKLGLNGDMGRSDTSSAAVGERPK